MRNTLGLVCLLAVLTCPAAASAQIADRVLADKIDASLRTYSPFSIFDEVVIAVDNGTVTLTGCVTMPFKRDEMGQRVLKIDGVRKLNNGIRVLPVSQQDSDLRMRVAQAIYGHPAFWPYATMARPPIHILVEAGRITLTGQVSSDVERSLAYALAHVPGAFDVKNGLRVERR